MERITVKYIVITPEERSPDILSKYTQKEIGISYHQLVDQPEYIKKCDCHYKTINIHDSILYNLLRALAFCDIPNREQKFR